MTKDAMGDDLDNAVRRAAQHATGHGWLPSVDQIRRRGEQRRRRATATRVIAAALIVVSGGGGWWLTHDSLTAPTPAATNETRPDPNPSPSPSASTPAQAEEPLTFTTPQGLILATQAEPGVQLVSPAAVQGPRMARWVVAPAPTSGQYMVRNLAQTDGLFVCLSMPAEEIVSAQTCDASSNAQQFTLTRVDSSEYTLSTQLGFVAAAPPSGTTDAESSGLTSSTDPEQAVRFTLSFPDRPGAVPDLQQP